MIIFFFSLFFSCAEFEGKYALDDDGDGFSEFDGDCNDQDSRVNPGESEICDSVDNNCNGEVDEGAIDGIMWYPDDDGDGFGRTEDGVNSCTPDEGFVSKYNDCNDSDPEINPVAQEICDEEGVDENCNEISNEPEVGGVLSKGTLTFYADSDGDGFGNNSSPQELCYLIDAYVEDNTDCDDSNFEIHPEAIEICDEIDNNCIDGIDENFALDAYIYFLDGDGDGYGYLFNETEEEIREWNEEDYINEDGQHLYLLSCKEEPPTGYSASSDDCNDDLIYIFPGSIEYCNDVDEDCDGETYDDESANAPLFYEDIDRDGFGGVESQQKYACSTPDGYSSSQLDCEDNNPLIFPTAPEICDGIDNNCDELIDGDDSINQSFFYADEDGDGFGDPNVILLGCEVPEGSVTNDEDCDDTDVNLNPNDIDQDGASSCNGDCDDNSLAFNILDTDGDGFTTCDNDCNDADASIHPDADEICDGDDNNCDELIDDQTSIDKVIYYLDSDADSFGTTSQTYLSCTPPDGYVDNSDDCNDLDETLNQNDADSDGSTSCEGDCDDTDDSLNLKDLDGDGFDTCTNDCNDGNELIHPNANEECDFIDNNCDEVIDGEDAVDKNIWYPDNDEDGFGGFTGYVESCNQPDGYLSDNTDCDDNDVNQNPSVDELCSTEEDDDCDGVINEDTAIDVTLFFLDSDSDGFGIETYFVGACTLGFRYAEREGDDWDCDDNDSLARPYLTEYCNEKDDDCDGLVDELLSEDSDSPAQDTVSFYLDEDGDGFGALDTEQTSLACPNDIEDLGSLVADNNEDCDDNNAEINPEASEICDETIDMNCDDDFTLGATDPKTWYVDADGDEFGDPDVFFRACIAPVGFIEDSTDCNDLDSESYPGAEEVCNGKRDNCNGEPEVIIEAWFSEDQPNYDAGLDVPLREIPLNEWDNDGDGFVDCISTVSLQVWSSSQRQIIDEAGLYIQGLVSGFDCDDSREYVYPGASETCNGIFDNCLHREETSEGITEIELAPDDEIDNDEDGFVECSITDLELWLGTDIIISGDDCNDSVSYMYPRYHPDTNIISCYGDLDDDGYPDKSWDLCSVEQNLDDAPLQIIGEENFRLGNQVASINIDGDGIGDFLLSTTYQGDSVYLFKGSSLQSKSSVSLHEADYIFHGDEDSHDTFYLSDAGDLNNDGIDDVVIGVTIGPGDDTGKVYIFMGDHLNHTTQHYYLSEADYVITTPNSYGSSFFGANFSYSGDVNGDGFDDLLISSSHYGETNIGTIYIFLGDRFGSQSEINTSQADYTFFGEHLRDWAGNSVSLDGDIDGDGLSDIVIGAQGNDEGGDRAGKIYIVFGSSLPDKESFNLADSDLFLLGTHPEEMLGGSFSISSDLDGDNLNDLIIGSYNNQNNGTISGNHSGLVSIYYGSTLSLATSIDTINPDVQIEGNAGERFGFVTGGGDLDGDGLDDLLVTYNGNPATGIRQTGIFLGSSIIQMASLNSSDFDFKFSAFAYFRSTFISDIDGDGLDDVLLGTPSLDNGYNWTGGVSIFSACE